MILMQWLSFLIIVALVFVHGVRPEIFLLDTTSMLLLLLLAIPLLAPFLKKAKWFGAEFEFKQEIRKAQKLVEKSEAQAKQKRGVATVTAAVMAGEATVTGAHGPELPSPGRHIGLEEKGSSEETVALKIEVERPVETFSTSTARALLSEDPNIALAALRIEMERVLTCAVYALVSQGGRPKGILSIADSAIILNAQGLISVEQKGAILTITKMCNKAVHGAIVVPAEAEEILDLADRLNNSFPFGYSLKISPNDRYKEQGLLCEWEHCVEVMPVTEEDTELSCPVFGHDCPGGLSVRRKCKKIAKEIQPERIIKRPR